MRIVLHIDMDAFFAAVEERDKPRLKGMPIVVGADPAGGHGRGVVSTANYAARKYGIKSAMPISKAWDLSQQAKRAGKPEVAFMGGSYHKYGEVSREIFQYIATKGDPPRVGELPRVEAGAFEQTSVDEGYLELFGSSWEAAEKIAKEIQDYVQEHFQLSCSIGVGPNKLIAKIAAGVKKPHGLMVVREKEVQNFLDPMSVRELMGIGPKAGERLRKMGIETIRQLRTTDYKLLTTEFGKHGEGMFRSARGIDDSAIEGAREAKSIGSEVTFDMDTLDPSQILAAFKEQATEVAKYLKRDKFKFRTVSIVVRFSDFETKTRAHTVEEATDDINILEREGLRLLLPFLDSRENPRRLKLRLVGIRAEKLTQ